MQKDTAMPPSSTPSASTSAPGADQQASVSGVPSKSETGHQASLQAPKKPSIAQVILEVMADKGVRGRVSLATLKKALAATGYNMARNDWRFKKVLKGLVDKGLLRQVTSKGASGSFRMGKKHASSFKCEAKRREQPRPRKRRFLLSSKRRGPKQLPRAAPRAAGCPCD